MGKKQRTNKCDSYVAGRSNVTDHA